MRSCLARLVSPNLVPTMSPGLEVSHPVLLLGLVASLLGQMGIRTGERVDHAAGASGCTPAA